MDSINKLQTMKNLLLLRHLVFLSLTPRNLSLTLTHSLSTPIWYIHWFKHPFVCSTHALFRFTKQQQQQHKLRFEQILTLFCLVSAFTRNITPILLHLPFLFNVFPFCRLCVSCAALILKTLPLIRNIICWILNARKIITSKRVD